MSKIKFKRKVNEVRKSIKKALTKNIRYKNQSFQKNDAITNVNRVLICRPNHRLGNLLLITPLLQEVSAKYPDCKIDLFVKGNIAPEIFKNYTTIDTIIQLPKKPFKQPFQYLKSWLKIRRTKYDLTINADRNSSSGRLSTQYSNSRFKFFGDTLNVSIASFFCDFEHVAKTAVYDFRFVISSETIFDWNEKVPNLDLKLDASELSHGQRILQKIAPVDKKIISLFTYATGDKCHCTAWWEGFYENLCLSFPDHTIIEILPVENVSQIGFKAASFYSRDIREIAAVIANTSIFIGADSGIMHLASAAKVPVVGLFSVTNPKKYRPYNNNSVAIDTTENDIENIIEVLDTLLRHRLYY
ncbi:glycosyltransferase family 9 protein [Flavobacterium sp. RS13.1]|uniref:glycosyltransferase family 9 protein n=1 Tax=Flavobacterium sp. RS13.1 TaxID=3400345 RepID=UPI003AAFBE09